MQQRRRLVPILILALIALLVAGLLPSAVPSSAAGATIKVNRSSAGWGDPVTVTGSGFHAGDVVVLTTPYVQNNNQKSQQITTAGVDNNGNFQVTFLVPGNAKQQAVTITARDFHGDADKASLTILAVVNLHPGAHDNKYVVGTRGFFVHLYGWQAGEGVTLQGHFPLYNGNTLNTNKQVQVYGNGAYQELYFDIPSGTKVGTASFTAQGNSSKKSADATLHVVYLPHLELSTVAIHPGTNVVVKGYDFIPGVPVDVRLVDPSSGVSVSRRVVPNGNGFIQATLYVGGNFRVGQYKVETIQSGVNYHPTLGLQVTVNPKISVEPNPVRPGEAMLVTGGGFSANATVNLYAVIPVQGGNRTARVSTGSNGSGGITTFLPVPTDAVGSTITIVAQGPNGQARVQAKIQPAPTPTPKPTLAPTNTPVPATAKPTSKPAPTQPAATFVPTPPAPTSTPIPKGHKIKGVGFRFVSIWYHTVRAGTYDHVVIQSNIHKTLGIWFHVYFPSGVHIDIYTNTNNYGRWEYQFNVPKDSRSSKSNVVVLTFQLWHGKKTVKDVHTITLV